MVSPTRASLNCRMWGTIHPTWPGYLYKISKPQPSSFDNLSAVSCSGAIIPTLLTSYLTPVWAVTMTSPSLCQPGDLKRHRPLFRVPLIILTKQMTPKNTLYHVSTNKALSGSSLAPVLGLKQCEEWSSHSYTDGETFSTIAGNMSSTPSPVLADTCVHQSIPKNIRNAPILYLRQGHQGYPQAPLSLLQH